VDSPIEPHEGGIYSYLDIDPSSGLRGRIGSSVIEFRVRKQWLSDNGFDRRTITLMRLGDNVWQELKTVVVAEDTSYVYYKAVSPGFSVFAIVAKQECEEKWVCDSWTECSKAYKKRTRQCVDESSCGTEKEMPRLEEGCVYAYKSPKYDGKKVGETRLSDGVDWRWDGAKWVQEGTPGYENIGQDADGDAAEGEGLGGITGEAVIDTGTSFYDFLYRAVFVVVILFIVGMVIWSGRKPIGKDKEGIQKEENVK